MINVNKKYDVIRARSNASGALGPCSICMCYLMLDAQSALQAPCSCGAQDIRSQWLFFGRNIGLLTLKVIYFHYLKIYFLDQSIQKICYLILKKEALSVVCMPLLCILLKCTQQNRTFFQYVAVVQFSTSTAQCTHLVTEVYTCVSCYRFVELPHTGFEISGFSATEVCVLT